MEPYKRAKYSKSLDPDEIEEVLLDEDSDEELEDRDEVLEPRVQSSSSSENEGNWSCVSDYKSRGFFKFLEFYWTSKWR